MLVYMIYLFVHLTVTHVEVQVHSLFCTLISSFYLMR